MNARIKIMVMLVFLCGCSGQTEEYPHYRPVHTVFEFTGEGGTLPCDIIFDTQWNIEGGSEWSDITPDYGNGKATVSIRAEEFTGDHKVRTSEYVAESSDERIYLIVVQRSRTQMEEFNEPASLPPHPRQK